MGINGGRNLRGIEGDPAEEGLYQRVNVTFPPSILKRLDKFMKEEDRPRSWVIQKAVDEWLKAVTGEGFNVNYYLDYLEEKFTKLYGLE